MIRLKRVLSAGALLFASIAAHAVDTTHTFDSVTAVQHSEAGTGLTGVLVNDTVPSSMTVPQAEGLIGSRCAKYYDMMLEKPGIYTLDVTIRTTVSEQVPGGPPVTRYGLAGCRLELKP